MALKRDLSMVAMEIALYSAVFENGGRFVVPVLTGAGLAASISALR